MRSRSDRLLGLGGLVVGLIVALAPILGSVRTASRVIVAVDDVVSEDLWAFGGRTFIEGRIEGDLVVIGGELRMTGVVEGDLVALVPGKVVIEGEVGGSVTVGGFDVLMGGEVSDDAAVAALRARFFGDVGRDLLVYVGDVDMAGTVGRDVRGQAFTFGIDGEIERDVVVNVGTMSMGDTAHVGGDVTFKSSRLGRISDGATVDGLLIQEQVITPVWARAVGRVVSVLSFLGFLLAGLALLWLFRATSAKAADHLVERPWRTAAVGLAMLVIPPIVATVLFVTLVGIPIAVIVLLAWVIGLFLGPAPTLAAVVRELSRRRISLLGAFVVGAAVWRLGLWLLPLLGVVVYLAALVLGLGAFGRAVWSQRKAAAPA